MKRERDWEVETMESPSLPEAKKSTKSVSSAEQCPYLATINRQMLDFDSEKLCSVTLTNRNVYVCLVCGKYFEGRGKLTPCFTHSVEHNHYVFMQVDSGRAYCLPDNYEIIDQSLADIRRCLQPNFSLQDIVNLRNNQVLARDVHNVSYLPGYIGLNNIGATDDVNVVLHMLSHITPIREFFLQPELYATAANDSKLLRDTGLLLRKLWSSGNFKSTISPQEFVQTLSVESKRRFSIGHRCEAADLFIYLLHTLQKHLTLNVSGSNAENNSKGKKSSVLFESLQGLVEVRTKSKRLVDNFQQQQLLERFSSSNAPVDADGWTDTTQKTRFTFLSLDIPPCPLFRDSQGGLVIPQIPLFQLIQRKFDPVQWTDSVTKDAHLRRQYRLLELPNVLIFHLNRFTKNNFALEKNPTIITFPVKNLEMKDYVSGTNVVSETAFPRDTEIDEITDATSLKQIILEMGSGLHNLELQHLTTRSNSTVSDKQLGIAELEQLRIIAKQATCHAQMQQRVTKYDLVACVSHESDNAARNIDVGDVNLASVFSSNSSAGGMSDSSRLKAKLHNAALSSSMTNKRKTNDDKDAVGAGDVDVDVDVVQRGHYKAYLALHATGQWFEAQDLAVSEISAQQVGVSEAYMLVYQKQIPSN